MAVNHMFQTILAERELQDTHDKWSYISRINIEDVKK